MILYLENENKNQAKANARSLAFKEVLIDTVIYKVRF